jgi:hypothetical protein
VTVTSRAVTTAVLAAAVAAAAYAGTLALVGVAVVLVAGLAAGGPRLVRSPAPGGATVVVALAGLGAVGVAWRTQGEPVLRHLPLVVAMALMLAFLAEMLRRDGRPRLVESVSGTVTGAVAAVAGAGWVASGRGEPGTALVVAAAAALAAAAAVSAIPAGRLAAAAAVVAAGGVGAAAGSVLPALDVVVGGVAGVVAGAVVAAVRLLLVRLPQLDDRRAGAAAAVVPVAVAGVLVFAVGRVFA